MLGEGLTGLGLERNTVDKISFLSAIFRTKEKRKLHQFLNNSRKVSHKLSEAAMWVINYLITKKQLLF